MIGLTGAQKIAVHEHKKNVIVSAGAGSGKTHVLVERYLALLEANPTWHLNNIVAITFTRKAADEMRDRVRIKLEDKYHLASAKQATLWADRWALWLAEIDGAQIDTIHGLCANLLRANFAEAGLDPDFAVLDDIQATMLLEQAVQTVFMALSAETPPAPELALFADFGENVVRDVVTDAGLLAMNVSPTIDPMTDYEQFVTIHILEIQTTANALGVYEWYDDDERWRILIGALGILEATTNMDEQLSAITSIADIQFRKKFQDETTKRILNDMRDVAKDIAKTILNAHTATLLNDHAQATETLWHGLINRVTDAYTQAKLDANVVDFDDLEKRAHDLLRNQAVIDRYRHKEILHLMVDEFQDTNPTQWGIVEALGGGDTTHMTFLVGDDKQSIYGFRGADVSVFHAVREKIVRADGKNPALTTSFRTQKRLIEWFNTLFDKLLQPNYLLPNIIRNFQVGYGDPMQANRETHHPHTPVTLLLINNQEAGKPDEKLKSEERREWDAQIITAQIKRLITEKTPVWDKKLSAYRPIQYRDIAILFRRMTYTGVYEEAFKQAGLPFITVAGKGYYDRQEVWDLINLLQAIHNPYDDLALLSALRSPLFGVSDDGLLALRLMANETASAAFWEILPRAQIDPIPDVDQPRFAHAHALITDLRAQMGRRTLAELLRVILDRTHYLAILSGLPDGDRRRGNIDKLIEKATSIPMLSLGEFVTYWRNLNEKEIREGEAPLEVGDTITLMTIHASKGLEYPVIFIPDAQSRNPSNHSPVIYEAGGTFACKIVDDNGESQKPFAYIWVNFLNEERAKAESLRLLYVAATRAGDFLFISGQVNAKKDGLTTNGWLKTVIDTLDIGGDIQEALLEQTVSLEINDTTIIIPQTRLSTAKVEHSAQTDLWQTDFSAIPPIPLPHLGALSIEANAPIRHLSATTLADLGSAIHAPTNQRHIFAQRFRQKVFHDAPERIDMLTHRRTSNRQIGEVVHEALRHWHLPSTMPPDNLRQILESYAWRFKVRDEIEAQTVVVDALKLLHQFEQTTIFDDIKHAKRVYRELPFVFNWGTHIIHGVIDVLCETANGWAIYDYKTSTVWSEDGQTDYAHHAERYHLQLAIYAHAVQKRLGVLPNAHLYYIRYNVKVAILAQALQAQMGQSLSERLLEMEQNGD